jgi:Na+/citrate or Na+/malate symporter
MLRYLKATVPGIIGGVIVGMAATWATLRLLMWWQMRQTGGGGGLGAVSLSLAWTVLAAVIGFLVVFFWMLRRSRQTT